MLLILNYSINNFKIFIIMHTVIFFMYTYTHLRTNNNHKI